MMWTDLTETDVFTDVLESLLVAGDSPDLVGRFAGVSRLCRRASESDLVWRALAKSRFSTAVLRHANPGGTWRDFFKSRCCVQRWTQQGHVWFRESPRARPISNAPASAAKKSLASGIARTWRARSWRLVAGRWMVQHA